MFLIPFLMAIYEQAFIHSALILMVIVFSLLFHINNERKWSILDQVFAVVLVLYNFYIFYLSGFKQPYFSLALFFVFTAFFFYFRQKNHGYEVNHSWWHLSSVLITTLCVLTY